MSLKLREKANSFDRVLRQRSAAYLKNAEKHALLLMEVSYEKNLSQLTRRIEKLKNGISRIRNDIEYGSFLSLPAFRSSRRFHREITSEGEEEIFRQLFTSELVLLECRNLFEKLQNVERKVCTTDEMQFLDLFTEVEESLRRIEELHLSRSSIEGRSLDSIINRYEEKVDELEKLAEKENLWALEESQISDVFPMNEGSLFVRFISAITRKPVFGKEISDVILQISEKLRGRTGGLVKLSALYSMVKTAKPYLNISLKDVESVVHDMEKKGLIPGLREVSGIKIVELVPVTATPDQNTILEMVANSGQLTLEELLLKTKWTYERGIRALKQLEEIGICRYDVVSRKWIFPSFIEDYKSEGV